MDEYDDPVTLELRTDREVAVLITALGIAAPVLLSRDMAAGAQAASNLQIRLVDQDAQLIDKAVSRYSDDGFLLSEGWVSNSAAVGKMADAEEVDPDEINEGRL